MPFYFNLSVNYIICYTIFLDNRYCYKKKYSVISNLKGECEIMNNKGKMNSLEVFSINMQMIADEFNENKIKIVYKNSGNSNDITQLGIFHNQEILNPKYVYIINSKDFTSELANCKEQSFIVLNSAESRIIDSLASIIYITDNSSFYDIFDIVQKVFEDNFNWAEKLQSAVINGEDLDSLCKISMPYFNNPVFVHSPQNYILGNSGWIEGMSPWDYDESTGRKLVSADLINDFKVDNEYINTLTTVGADIYSGNIRGFRCAYVNLYNDMGDSEGRLCINELLSPLKPGQLHAMEYLAKLINYSIQQQKVIENNAVKPFESLLKQILSGEKKDPADYAKTFERQGWNTNDRFICIKLSLSVLDSSTKSVISICNLIKNTFKGSVAFWFEDDIFAILNLTILNEPLNNCIPKLSLIIRECLLRAGISNEFEDIINLKKYYKQSDFALQYGIKKEPNIWCHTFDDIALNYISDTASNELGIEFICSPKLLKIREYDKINKSEFYDTLDLYLKNDKNAAKTAKDLFIHRSTLFYRLDKIRELFDIELEDWEEELYIRLSFFLLTKNITE